MKTIFCYGFLLIAGMSFSSCSTKLLVATFETDTPGSQPNKTLPADPAGDQIIYENEIAPRVRIQNSSTAGEKALHFSQVAVPDISEHRVWLTFKGASVAADKKVQFTWTGEQKMDGFGGEYVLADISVGSATFVRLFFYGDGRVKRITDIATDAGVVVGTINPRVRNNISVNVNVPERKFDLNITGSTEINATNPPFITYSPTVAIANPYNPALSFRLENGSNERRKYIVEYVEISHP